MRLFKVKLGYNWFNHFNQLSLPHQQCHYQPVNNNCFKIENLGKFDYFNSNILVNVA